jgi:hypothetical protein
MKSWTKTTPTRSSVLIGKEPAAAKVLVLCATVEHASWRSAYDVQAEQCISLL